MFIKLAEKTVLLASFTKRDHVIYQAETVATVIAYIKWSVYNI